MKIALTGHRPERLGLSYDVAAPEWKKIRVWLTSQIMKIVYESKEPVECITGMASGSDIAFGYVATDLAKDSSMVSVFCAMPCRGYNHKDKYYHFIKDNASGYYYAFNEYNLGADDARDEYMARECDIMLAIFDGNECGGVWSTIQKAKKYGKLIIYCPIEILKGNRYE